MIADSDIDALSRVLRRPTPSSSTAAPVELISPQTREAAAVTATEETRIFVAFGAGTVFVRHYPRSAPVWLMPTLKILGDVLTASLIRPNPLTLQYAVGLLPLVMLDQTPLPSMVLTPTGGLRFEWISEALKVDITVAGLGAARLLVADRSNNELIQGELSAQLDRLRQLMESLPPRQGDISAELLLRRQVQAPTPILTNSTAVLHRSQSLIDLAKRAALSVSEPAEVNIDEWAEALAQDVAQLND
jgi:hypothetical protein